jgi:uncharacterized protein (TIGR02246 family)
MRSVDDEREIRALVEQWCDAACKGDADLVVARHTPDIVMFDVPEPGAIRGLLAYRQTWELFFDHNPQGPARFRVVDLVAIVGADVAFAYGLLSINAGEARCRLTLGLRKIDSAWWFIHEHHSMPVMLS